MIFFQKISYFRNFDNTNVFFILQKTQIDQKGHGFLNGTSTKKHFVQVFKIFTFL